MKCGECLIWKNRCGDWQLCLSNYSYFAPLEGDLLREYEDNQRRYEKFTQLSPLDCREGSCNLI